MAQASTAEIGALNTRLPWGGEQPRAAVSHGRSGLAQVDGHVDADRIDITGERREAMMALHEVDRLGVVVEDDTDPSALAAVGPQHRVTRVS